MQELKQRLLKLVEEIYGSEEVKSKLKDQIETSGITPEILNQVQALLDGAVDNYLQKAEAEMEKMRKDIEDKTKILEQKMTAIETEDKAEKKAALRKKDQEELDAVRKALQSQ